MSVGVGAAGAKTLSGAAWFAAGGVSALGATGIVVEAFWRQPQVRVALVLLGVGGGLVGVRLARRTGRSVPLVVLAVWALLGILLLTLLPDPGGLGTPWRWYRVPLELTPQPRYDLTAWMHGTDGPLNVLLYLPAAALLTAVTRRALRTLLGLAGLSLGIEVLQAWSGWRSGSLGDVVANVLGAGVGVGVAVAARAVLAGTSGSSRRPGRQSGR